MPGVNVPGSPNDPMKTILPIAGSVVGGIYGGPAGSAAGAKIGQNLTQGGADPSAIQSDANTGGGAIDRRISSIESSPNSQLAMAQAALSQLPKEYQDAYGPTLNQASAAASQGA